MSSGEGWRSSPRRTGSVPPTLRSSPRTAGCSATATCGLAPRSRARCPAASPGRSATSPTPTAPTTRRTPSSGRPRSCGCRSRSASRPYLGSAQLGRRSAWASRSASSTAAAKLRVAEGVNDAWLTELFSPAFSEWLARSPDDFDWELANGVLCASRRGHLIADADLARLCSDAAHIATAIREECLEEVDSGEAKRSAAKTPKAKRQDVLVNSILERTTFDHPPADVSSSRPQFRHVVTSHPGDLPHRALPDPPVDGRRERDRRRHLRPPAEPAEPGPGRADLSGVPVRGHRLLRPAQPDQRHVAEARDRGLLAAVRRARAA